MDQFEDNDDLVKQWRIFIGLHANYYVREWLQIRKGKLLSFNLYAFCFGIFWLLYRKMYQPSVIVLSIYFAEGYLESIIIKDLPFEAYTWELVRIGIYFTFIGFTGNWIYYIHTQHELSKLLASPKKSNLTLALRKRGGISFLPIITLFLCILLIFYVNYYIRQ